MFRSKLIYLYMEYSQDLEQRNACKVSEIKPYSKKQLRIDLIKRMNDKTPQGNRTINTQYAKLNQPF